MCAPLVVGGKMKGNMNVCALGLLIYIHSVYVYGYDVGRGGGGVCGCMNVCACLWRNRYSRFTALLFHIHFSRCCCCCCCCHVYYVYKRSIEVVWFLFYVAFFFFFFFLLYTSLNSIFF